MAVLSLRAPLKAPFGGFRWREHNLSAPPCYLPPVLRIGSGARRRQRSLLGGEVLSLESFTIRLTRRRRLFAPRARSQVPGLLERAGADSARENSRRSAERFPVPPGNAPCTLSHAALVETLQSDTHLSAQKAPLSSSSQWPWRRSCSIQIRPRPCS